MCPANAGCPAYAFKFLVKVLLWRVLQAHAAVAGIIFPAKPKQY